MKKSDTVYQVMYNYDLIFWGYHSFYRKKNAEKFASQYEISTIIEVPRDLIDSISDFKRSLKKRGK